MTIESFNLIEHFDYMRNYIPQPFYIPSETVNDIVKGVDDEYTIRTTNGKYTLNKLSLKKLVDSLGIKIKLLSAVCAETDVIDLAMPIINKLFKCFADCFVFYARHDDTFTIIDLNVNNDKGEDGTKYENGPSPWKFDIKNNPSVFTCFADFKNKYCIDESDSDVMVKADDLMPNDNTVSMNLFRPVPDGHLQPMLTFTSKFSNMNGFSDIHTTLYDPETNIYIPFPMNYSKLDRATFSSLWEKAIHIHKSFDLNDYIFREFNELAASNETPGFIKSFISTIQTESILNVNQPIKDILNEANTTAVADMKPSKARKLKKAVGYLIAYAIVMKHSGCEHCGHIDLH